MGIGSHTRPVQGQTDCWPASVSLLGKSLSSLQGVTMQLRINFFGGPGVGKSTLAAQVYGLLRTHSHSAELAREWIKSWAYQGRQSKSFDAVYTFAHQLHEEDRLLQAGVQIVVTDSPVYLQCIYAHHQKHPCAEELQQIARQYDKTYRAINFLVKRKTNVSYEARGRYQSVDEAVAMDYYIENCLRQWRVPFKLAFPGTASLITGEIRDVIQP